MPHGQGLSRLFSCEGPVAVAGRGSDGFGPLGAKVSLSLALATFSQAMRKRQEAWAALWAGRLGPSMSRAHKASCLSGPGGGREN